MVTISKPKRSRKHRTVFFKSIRFKFVLSYVAFIAVLVIFLNLYPPSVSKSLVFASKKDSMQNQLNVIAASLSSLDHLTKETVAGSLSLSNNNENMRLIVADKSAKVVYDTAFDNSALDKYALFSEIKRALSGYNVFTCSFEDGTFITHASRPLTNSGLIIGALYIYEADTSQAELVLGMHTNLSQISVILCVTALFLALIFSKFFTNKIHLILAAIRHVRDGEYGYSMDIGGDDELSQLGQEFNSLSDRLKRTEDIRRRFVSDASHELKTPLASIRLLSDSIVQSQDMDIDTIREFVADIGDEAERLGRTSEKLLSLTRLDTNLPQQSTSLCDVSATITRVLRMLEPLASERGITLTSDLTDDCYIRITEDDLYAIVFNLVENAIKYNYDNGNVNVMSYAHNSLVRIVIDDTGVGIPEEDLPHIFDRFYRVDKARSREAGGSGLGLSIVRDTVVSYGGTVEIMRRSKGTRFRICFPQSEGGE